MTDVDAATADRNTSRFPLGARITAGKTKVLYVVKDKPDMVLIVSKDDITADNGAKHDLIPNKGVLATTTTCNVFELLKAHGVPVAFIQRDNMNSFVAPLCRMLPYEVVVRREAHGSYLKRNPGVQKGMVFGALLVEWFLKTKDRRWGEHELISDDPLMIYNHEDGEIDLYDPGKPDKREPFLTLSEGEVFTEEYEWTNFQNMEDIARQTFMILEQAWKCEDGRLVDFKVEFGIAPDGQLLLADVIDNDSWRVIESNEYIDKQAYRDGESLDRVAKRYAHVAQVTSRFQS